MLEGLCAVVGQVSTNVSGSHRSPMIFKKLSISTDHLKFSIFFLVMEYLAVCSISGIRDYISYVWNTVEHKHLKSTHKNKRSDFCLRAQHNLNTVITILLSNMGIPNLSY